MRKRFLAAVLAVGAMGTFSANAAVFDLVAAGSLWEYTFADPTANTSWNTTTGGWDTGLAPFGNNIAGPGSLYPNVDPDGHFDFNTPWAVGPADDVAPYEDDLWVRTTFNVDQLGWVFDSFTWGLGTDNGYTLYLNGNLISGPANADGYTYRWEYSGILNQHLNLSGVNVLAVALEDHGGLTAFDMQVQGIGTYTEPTNSAPAVVPIPAAAPLGLLGMGVVSLIARRRKTKA